MTITANGSGFTAAPSITITGGGGTTATITASVMSALDIMNVTVNYNNFWRTLDYAYFTAFQAQARQFRMVTGQPVLWSKGPGSSTAGGDYFYIFQIPDQGYQCDVDAILQPNPLVDDTTPEQIQYPYTDCVQYYACYLAKYKQQQFNESANFIRIYDELMRRGAGAKTQRRIPSAY